MTRAAVHWRRLLVVVEEEGDPALPDLLRCIAERTGAALEALAVAEVPDAGRIAGLLGVGRDALEAEAQRVAGVRLTAWRTVPGVRCTTRVGRPLLEIVRAVRQGSHDLLVKDVRARTGLGARVLGGLDRHLLRKSPVPVWLHRPPAPGPGSCVLAAVELGLEDADDPDALEALNHRILAQAGAVAHALDAALHVVHVWDAPAEQLLARWSPERETVERYMSEVERENRRRLSILVTRTDGGSRRTATIVPHLRRGDPREEIPALASLLGARLVVLGTVARAGIPGLLIGNTAEDLVQRLDTGILAVKPEGFVSPVDPGPEDAP